MKLILITLLLTLSMSTYAGQSAEEAIRSKVICKEGYKFLIVWTAGKWMPPSVVQIFEVSKYGDNIAPQPIKCK